MSTQNISVMASMTDYRCSLFGQSSLTNRMLKPIEECHFFDTNDRVPTINLNIVEWNFVMIWTFDLHEQPWTWILNAVYPYWFDYSFKHYFVFQWQGQFLLHSHTIFKFRELFLFSFWVAVEMKFYYQPFFL